MLAACGGVPGNGVARVDDTVIKKSTFDHWIAVAALSSQAPGSTAATTVPDAPNFTQIVAYYNSNKTRFGQPQRRDLLVVLTKDQATANKAKSALSSGQSFASVAKKYSIDDASK